MEKSAPEGWIRFFGMVEPGDGIPSKSQIRRLEKMFTLLDFRPEKNNEIIISTISMCHNCLISFSLLRGVPFFSRTFGSLLG